MTKASVPISDLIVTVTRFCFLTDPSSLKRSVIYFIALFRVIRWFLCPNPVRFWVGLSKLDSRQQQAITFPIDVIISVILLSNFATCIWVYIGNTDRRHREGYDGWNSWIFEYSD